MRDICSKDSGSVHSQAERTMPLMKWRPCIIWFLFVSVCECMLDTEPVMYGEVQSPQYPKPYAPNVLKQWDLSVPEGFQIRLTFVHLDIEPSAGCFYDSLTVLYNDNVLGKFCGRESSADGHHPGTHPIVSPGSRLTLIFQTDDGNPERHQNVGFSAQYQAIDRDECSEPEPADGSGPLCSDICLNTLGSYLCSCHYGYELRSDQRTCDLSCGGGIFDELRGHLSSPGFPQAPPHSVSCQYILSVEAGFTISLNFSDQFHIEALETPNGPNCIFHWLQVTIPDQEPRKLCGNESPGLVLTNSNTVTLDYHTDDLGQSNGWSLDYSTQRVQCPTPGIVANGRVTPALPEYLYRDYIFVRCDQGYKLMMDGEEITSFSTICQNSGQWHLPLPTCQIIDCGEPKPLLNGGVTFLSGFQNQYLSVVQYHCNQPFYSLVGNANLRFTCEADREWRSTQNDIVSPLCIPVCGRPTKRFSDFQRIIGGKDAPNHTIPWQVLLTINDGRGGGMVIGDQWVLTAAHNVISDGEVTAADIVRIYMGNTDVETMIYTPLLAETITVHPGYNNPNSMNYNHDIALIKLTERLTFNSSIMPVCLPAAGDTYTVGKMGLVSGFGISKDNRSIYRSNKLKYVHLPVVSDVTCSRAMNMAKTKTPNIPSLTDNMICAGFPEGGKDSCQGDSGGPFALEDHGRFWAAGIVSWGVNCGERGQYGAYTKVSNYVDWITKTMQEN